MSIEKMREEFEAWAAKDAESVGVALNPKTMRDGDWYGHNDLNTAWAAWQASQEARAQHEVRKVRILRGEV